MALFAHSLSAPVMQAAPHYVADLRPAADAAATTREDRAAPSVAIAPVNPPSPTQIAEVNRSMASILRPNGETPGTLSTQVQQTERTLKPYGITMLPRSEADADNRHG